LTKYQQIIKQRDDLKLELERKERLSLQAIAARSNMKSLLDNAVANIKSLESDREKMIIRLKDAEEEVAYYKQKHDSMFGSVSSLNKRIEELEQHKLHLLDKLKKTVRPYM
jgi:chromosome segregation ATPase